MLVRLACIQLLKTSNFWFKINLLFEEKNQKSEVLSGKCSLETQKKYDYEEGQGNIINVNVSKTKN